MDFIMCQINPIAVYILYRKSGSLHSLSMFIILKIELRNFTQSVVFAVRGRIVAYKTASVACIRKNCF